MAGMPGNKQKNAENMQKNAKICKNNRQNMQEHPKICKCMHKKCRNMQINMQKNVKISTVLAKICKNMQEICKKYAIKFAGICRNMRIYA